MLLNCGVGEDSWESLGVQPVHPKADQSWVFIGRADVEAETPVLWPPNGKSWLIWKDPDAGKDWGQEEKGMTEDEMVGWHHWFNGHGFGWTQGVGDGQGSLVCCGSWGRKESVTTEQLNWTERCSIDKRQVKDMWGRTIGSDSVSITQYISMKKGILITKGRRGQMINHIISSRFQAWVNIKTSVNRWSGTLKRWSPDFPWLVTM